MWSSPRFAREVAYGILGERLCAATGRSLGNGETPARESIFSGLNNLALYDTLDAQHAAAFGFTEPEVSDLAARVGAADRLDVVRDWYDGYRFGGNVIYNPWSVLNFFAAPGGPARPYWRFTSSDDILRHLLLRQGPALPDWETLLSGAAVERTILASLPLRDLDRTAEAVWSFLLFSGYLTATEADYSGGDLRARLRIPNREVRGVFESTFSGWLRDPLGSDLEVEALLRALLRGDAQAAGSYLTRVLTEQASYHDFPRRSGEAIYHALGAVPK